MQHLVKRFHGPAWIDRDDLMQEGRIGLLRGIRTYDPARGLSFRAFVSLCIRNEMQASLHRPLRTALATVDIDGYDMADAEPSPEHATVSKLWVESICNQLRGTERRVMMLFIEGVGMKRIAIMTELTYKQVDNALSRAKRKLRR